MLNLLDLKDAELEDEYIEASYTSEQPLANCGFIGNTGLAYTITSINTIEIVDLETMLVIKDWNKFDHDINYAIQGQYINDRMLFFMGNNLGEVYLYQYGGKEQGIEFLDMVMTKDTAEAHSSAEGIESVVVRNAFMIDDENLLLSTDTNSDHIMHYKFDNRENGKVDLHLSEEIKFESSNNSSMGYTRQEGHEDETEETISPTLDNGEKKRRKFKPF